MRTGHRGGTELKTPLPHFHLFSEISGARVWTPIAEPLTINLNFIYRDYLGSFYNELSEELRWSISLGNQSLMLKLVPFSSQSWLLTNSLCLKCLNLAMMGLGLPSSRFFPPSWIKAEAFDGIH